MYQYLLAEFSLRAGADEGLSGQQPEVVECWRTVLPIDAMTFATSARWSISSTAMPRRPPPGHGAPRHERGHSDAPTAVALTSGRRHL
jgi:hypothetical protein